MDDYLAKPYTRAALLAVLARWRPPHQAAEAPEREPAVTAQAARRRRRNRLPSSTRPPCKTCAPCGVPGRPDVLGRIIDLFYSDAPRLLGQLEVAAEASDAAALQLAAHTLKPAAPTWARWACRPPAVKSNNTRAAMTSPARCTISAASSKNSTVSSPPWPLKRKPYEYRTAPHKHWSWWSMTTP